jgi:hypothetical protein
VLTLKYLLRKGFDMEIESSTVENRGSVNWRKENRAPRGAQALFLPCVAVLPCDGPGRPGPPLGGARPVHRPVAADGHPSIARAFSGSARIARSMIPACRRAPDRGPGIATAALGHVERHVGHAQGIRPSLLPSSAKNGQGRRPPTP